MLNILQSVATYLFKYFVSHISVIPRTDAFLCYETKISFSNFSNLGFNYGLT